MAFAAGSVVDLVLRCTLMTLAILATYAAVIVALAGIGLGLRRAFGLGRASLAEVLAGAWLGFAAVLTFLLAWNLARPVDGLARAVLLAASAAGWWASRGALDLRLPGSPRARAACAVAIASFGAWLANHGIGANASFDCALYNLQGVAWAHTAPAVPGIANLYGPLGHVHASFLYAAALEAGPWAGRASHVANGPLLWLLAAQGLVAAASVLARAREAASASTIYAAAGLLAALVFGLGTAPASVEPELAMNALVLVAGGALLRLAAAEDVARREVIWTAFGAFALLAASVVAKASAVPFAAVGGALACGLLAWRLRERVVAGVALAAAPAVLLAALWVARSVVLTGYPFYPLAVLPFSVDWVVPAAHPAAALAHIQYTARGNSWEVGRVWYAWFWSSPGFVFAPLELALLALAGSVARRARFELRSADLAALPALAALLAWWIASPFIEYGSGFAWSLAGICAARAARFLAPSRVIAGALAALAVLAIAQPVWVDARRFRPQGALAALARAHGALPPEGAWLRPPTHPYEPARFVTETGLVLSSPERFCVDAPLPCTPHPSTNLALRRPGELASGFRVTDCEWAMQRWPTPQRSHWWLEAWRERRAKSGDPH